MNQNPLIRVLIADDHPVVRTGLAAILEIHPEENIVVVGQASDGQEAIDLFTQLQPDVTLIDLRMPKVDGVGVIIAIRQRFPTAKLVILTTYDSEEDIYRGLHAGAKAYLLKDAPHQDLLNCVRAVHSGESFIPPKISTKFFQRMNLPTLSEREREVVRLIATGRTNQGIAEVLGISEGTVKFHVNNILSKLQVNDRTEAVILALKRGIITL
ncbi:MULTISPECIES: response regulator transcription factor [Nostoc]|uniref:Response regulator transcription factor n=1 Tax=Nostoc paludosum FACHB-159 TaxID=2692908 RepID=A0ABR8KIL6_9NOSO|nr:MULTISPECIES: response regulator transcription factor [Nostoc]MBD2682315.1 response regulator transcription factor [Nostoc sp. FACHB-857]MBD2738648.1 response regulator transcription factor [Nostoc paludosum FACHB-159]